MYEINAQNDNTANLKRTVESLLAEESEEESEDSPEESLDRINTLSKKAQGIANRGSDIALGAVYQHTGKTCRIKSRRICITHQPVSHYKVLKTMT